MRRELMKFTHWAASMLAMVVILVGCASDDADFYTPDNTIDPNEVIDPNSVGYLSLKSLALEVSLESEQLSSDSSSDYELISTATRADDGTFDDYVVTIYNSDGEIVYQKSYAETMALTEPLELPAGYYTVVVSSHAEIPTTGDYPCYASSGSDADTYAVGDDKEVEVSNTITCKLANIKVSASISADLLSKFKPVDEIDTDAGDVFLTVTMLYSSASLSFTNNKEESEIGSKSKYFAKNSDTNSMTVRMTGMYNIAAADEDPNYNEISWSEMVSDVDSGQAREVSVNIDNYSDGKLLCQFDVESWIEESTLGVDVQSSISMMYAIGEDAINDPDSESTDQFSPETLITLGGEAFDTAEEYVFGSSIFDEDLLSYSNPIVAYVSPYGTTSVSSVSLKITSENSTLMSDLETMTDENGELPLWSGSEANSAMSQYMTIRDDAGTIKLSVLYAGMVALERYKGEHTIKIVAKGSNNMKSYTTFMVNVISESGPTIEWSRGSDGTIYDFATRYRVYSDDDVFNGVGVNPEVVVTIDSGVGLTGLTVAITSPVLPESELNDLNLSSEMDLINPDTEKMAAALRGLGFPVEGDVEGQTSIVFDISNFMPMLALLSSKDYVSGDEIDTDFTITATDENGEQECIIMVYHIQP